MKIVVLDGYAVNPGDLAWTGLERLGEVTVYDRTSPEELQDRARGAWALITNKVPLTAESIAALPDLRYIGVTATGWNVIDGVAARARNIPVTNVPGYSTRAVAQHTIALMLELTNHVGLHALSVREGDWARGVEWCYWREPITELAGLTLGIVGWGAIGQAVGAIAQSLGMVLCGASRNPVPGVERVEVDELFRRSDVVSLHCPLTPQTSGLVNARRLSFMKPTALLINTARGGLIIDQDLDEALRRGRLAGAALDVLSQEPPPADHPLLSNPRCLMTPHQAWSSYAARARLLDITAQNLAAFLRGERLHVVN